MSARRPHPPPENNTCVKYRVRKLELCDFPPAGTGRSYLADVWGQDHPHGRLHVSVFLRQNPVAEPQLPVTPAAPRVHFPGRRHGQRVHPPGGHRHHVGRQQRVDPAGVRAVAVFAR